MTVQIKAEHTTALRSAVDLLTNCVSPDYAKEVLGDYQQGKSRHPLAVSLYAVIDAIERNEVEYTDPF